MPKTAAPKAITDLVNRFREQREHYQRPEYNETQVRREFVDPFFKALGWDVDNTQGYAEAYKDVIHEDSIKVAGSTKAPDYSFRVGGTRKFFVETKKPSVNLKVNPEPAFQLRRYAWSAKLPLSILTDFEELAVYDTRVRPSQSDSASLARTIYITFDQYEERWDEIASLFSHEAVLKGAFDKYADSKKKKRGTTEVDDAFLALISEWRLDLAKNINKNNEDLSDRALNQAVQTTIDRIIFLRICEDRGTENYARLRKLNESKDIYQGLLGLYYDADDRYNSGLFHFKKEKHRATEPDEFTTKLAIDDKVLKDIIKAIYYPSPYDFRVFPAEVLGQVYERFLGQVITRSATGKTVKLEDKPEVRKAGGVYYTPTYIVDYIVEHTVGELVKDKQPHEVAGRSEKTFKPAKGKHPIRALDPACGSGSFLLGAYQFLLDWHLKAYMQNTAKWAKGAEPTIVQLAKNDIRLTIAERKRILTDHIYGVDIDRGAVEVTKLSLLLKCLEGESTETIGSHLFHMKERALPDLGANIKCGNSLIGTDFYDDKDADEFTLDDRMRINDFDWDTGFRQVFADGGFDAVIGNPPYDVLEKDRGKTSWPHEALADYVERTEALQPATGGKTNLFRFFLVRSIQICRSGGKVGAIVPLALLGDISCGQTRRHVASRASRVITHAFPQKDNRSRRVFRDAKLSTCVLTFETIQEQDPDLCRFDLTVHPGRLFEEVKAKASITYGEASLLDPRSVPIPQVNQDDLAVCTRIYETDGVTTMGSDSRVDISRGEINQTTYVHAITQSSEDTRLVKGVEISPYAENAELSQGEREWLDPTCLTPRKRESAGSDRRRIATQRITGIDDRFRLVATIIEPTAYFADSTNSVRVTSGVADSLEYVLALINSRLYQWRFKATSTNNNVSTNELEALPWIPDALESREAHTLASKARRLLDLNDELARDAHVDERRALQQQIDQLDREIDQLVYQLYGLSDEEIAIVEAATAEPDKAK